MTAPLRHISVHVEEPDGGQYVWVLAERGDGDHWPEIDRSKTFSATFKKAMADGLVKLESLVNDRSVGPSHPPKKVAPGSRRLKSLSRTPVKLEEETPPKRPSLFGFGPAR